MTAAARPVARRGFARRNAAVLVFASLLFAGAASAETYVLVYAEGSVIALNGGATVMPGARIEAAQPVRLGVADKAIFISESGNVVCLNGPYHGALADDASARGNGLFDSLRAIFEKQPQTASSGGCSR